MGIFHDEEFFQDEFFDPGGVVEVPNSVLLSSVDAQTIADTYGVSVEDVLIARQTLFAQQAPPPQASYSSAPSYPPRSYDRPPARPSRGPRVIVRPRRVVDYRTGGGHRPSRRPRGPSSGRRPPFRTRAPRR